VDLVDGKLDFEFTGRRPGKSVSKKDGKKDGKKGGDSGPAAASDDKVPETVR
jgi:hypothetical protein